MRQQNYFLEYFYTSRESYRRREMYSVCLCVGLSPHSNTTGRTQM